MKSLFTTKTLCITAIFMALTCVATIIVQIPIPLGYAHLGDSVILITSFFFGPVVGAFASGIGSMLADLITGYPIWALPTLFIKTLMPVIACFIMGNFRRSVSGEGKAIRMFSARTISGSAAALVWMVILYTFFGCILYGSVAAGLASAPGLALKAAVDFVVFIIIGKALESAGFRRIIS